jgi:hypothetical protein
LYANKKLSKTNQEIPFTVDTKNKLLKAVKDYTQSYKTLLKEME